MLSRRGLPGQLVFSSDVTRSLNLFRNQIGTLLRGDGKLLGLISIYRRFKDFLDKNPDENADSALSLIEDAVRSVHSAEAEIDPKNGDPAAIIDKVGVIISKRVQGCIDKALAALKTFYKTPGFKGIYDSLDKWHELRESFEQDVLNVSRKLKI